MKIKNDLAHSVEIYLTNKPFGRNFFYTAIKLISALNKQHDTTHTIAMAIAGCGLRFCNL